MARSRKKAGMVVEAHVHGYARAHEASANEVRKGTEEVADWAYDGVVVEALVVVEEVHGASSNADKEAHLEGKAVVDHRVHASTHFEAEGLDQARIEVGDNIHVHTEQEGVGSRRNYFSERAAGVTWFVLFL